MREQLSSKASENSNPNEAAKSSSALLHDLKAGSPINSDVLLFGDHGLSFGAPAKCNPNIGEILQSSVVSRSPLRLLVADEISEAPAAIYEIATSLGFLIDEADSFASSKGILARRQTDILLVDVTQLEAGVRSLLEEMKATYPGTVVIVMSANATIDAAVNAMRLGASDYLSRPVPLHVLTKSLERAAMQKYFDIERMQLEGQPASEGGIRNVLGRSTEMEKLCRILTKVAGSRHPVMIIGEDGTGKQLVAESIHVNGEHPTEPFISLDCKTLGPTLLEIELFGHLDGAIAESNLQKGGLLASPQGGTLFLDDIGDMPLDLQAKLTKALKRNETQPLGGKKAVPISVRIVAATTRDLAQMINEGTFRLDLYNLLSVVNLRIPPLRGRPEDVVFLAQRFLEKIQRQTGIKRTLSRETLRMLETYDWPGNVRELEESLSQACSRAPGEDLRTVHLPQNLLGFHQKKKSELAGTPFKKKNANPVSATEMVVPIATMEERVILEAIRQTNGDKQKAAKLLGIGKTTIYRKLKEYGLSDQKEPCS
jgi:two-component system response regulator HydG